MTCYYVIFLQIPRKWTHHITTVLFLGFGLWSLWDAFNEEYWTISLLFLLYSLPFGTYIIHSVPDELRLMNFSLLNTEKMKNWLKLKKNWLVFNVL